MTAQAGGPSPRLALPELSFRRPTELDYPPIVRVLDDWWADRHAHVLLPRLWLRHFTGTSWVAETLDGRLAGFLIGFLSPDRPDVACCHLVGTNPNLRRRGLGRALYERFFDDARAAGRHEVQAVTWPGNRGAIAFHRALGFAIDAGAGTQLLYGSPAYPAHEFGRDDLSLLARQL